MSASIINFPNRTKAAEHITVTFRDSESDIVKPASFVCEPLRDDQNVSLLVFGRPDNQTAGDSNVTITVHVSPTIAKSVSFMYTFYDMAATRFVGQTPTQVPTVAMINGMQRSLQPKIALLFANFPVSSVRREDLRIFVEETDSEPQILSISELVTCTGGQTLDCNRTVIEVLLQPQLISGVKLVSVKNSATNKNILPSFGVNFVTACDYDAFCGINSVVDFFAVMDAPVGGGIGTPCVLPASTVCVFPEKIPEPVVVRISPSTGLVTGGTVVNVSLSNFPALVPQDVTVQLMSGAGATIYCSVISFIASAGATLTSSSSILTFRTPAVARDASMMPFRISTSVSPSVSREITVVFEYLPVVTGRPVVIMPVSKDPHSDSDSDSLVTISENEPLNLVVEARNMPRIEPDYDPALVRIKIGTRPSVPVDRIISSTRASTVFAYSLPGPWKLVSRSETMRVSFCYTDMRSDCEEQAAATFNVTIAKTPDPFLISMFPEVVLSNETSTITTTIMFLNPATTLSSLSLRLIIPSTSISERITPTLLTSLAPSSCVYSDCSKFSLIFSVPRNPAGPDKSGTALIMISALGRQANATLKYKASGSPILELLMPRSAALTSSTHAPITMFLRNFPSAECKDTSSCRDEASEGHIKVLFDGIAGVIVPGTLTDAGELLRLQVVPPSLTSARVARCVIQVSNRAAKEVSVGFAFAYTDVGPWLSPSEGVSTGQTLVTLTAVGVDRLASAQDLSLMLCFQQVPQLTVIDSVSASNTLPSITVAFKTPPCAPGTSQGTLAAADGSASVSFLFSYFTAPKISTITPSAATVDGRTSCGTTAVLRVIDLPTTTSASTSDTTVEIAGVTCGLPAECHVISIVQAQGYMDLTVKVPPAPEGEQPVRVASHGRTAIGTLTYFQPPMEIQSVRWCSKCTSRFCISNGVCTSTQTVPRENAAPITGLGYVVLVVDNMPPVSFDTQGKLEAASSVTVDFGGESVLHRVSYSTALRTELEFTVQKLGAPVSGTYQLSVRTPASPVTYSARFSFAFFDDRIDMSCVNGCTAPSTGSDAVTVILTNFFVPAGNTADLLAVSFGTQTAASVSVISTNQSMTQLSIVPSSCNQCVFTRGAAMVDLSVSFKASRTWIGSITPFTFWAVPRVSSARFDPIGIAIIIRFDQATNRANTVAAHTQTSCAGILSPASLSALGTSGVSCIWRAEDVMEVNMGPDATVTVGSALQIQASANITSANGVSQRCSSSFVVQVPETPVRPTIVVSGTAVVDRCSDTHIEATSNSPRALRYIWSSSHEAINEQLRGYTGPRPVFDLRVLDTPVSIYVYGVDFLYRTSDVTEYIVVRQTSAVPHITFFPPNTSTYADQEVLVTARAEFSDCTVIEKDLLFEWTQIQDDQQKIPAGMKWLVVHSLHVHVCACGCVCVCVCGEGLVV
jgi:hypothetical protein